MNYLIILVMNLHKKCLSSAKMMLNVYRYYKVKTQLHKNAEIKSYEPGIFLQLNMMD